MTLEKIIIGAENKIKDLPWWAKIIFYPEYAVANNATTRAKQLMHTSKRDENWYMNIGECYNDIYFSGRNVVDKTFTLYESLRSIPVVGSFVENLLVNKINNFLPNANKYVNLSNKEKYVLDEIPAKKDVLDTMDSFYEIGLKWLTTAGEIETNVSEEKYWTNLNKVESSVRPNTSFMDYLIEGISSLKELFEGVTHQSYAT